MTNLLGQQSLILRFEFPGPVGCQEAMRAATDMVFIDAVQWDEHARHEADPSGLERLWPCVG